MSAEPTNDTEKNLTNVEKQISKLEAEMMGKEMSDGRYYVSGRHATDEEQLRLLKNLRMELLDDGGDNDGD